VLASCNGNPNCNSPPSFIPATPATPAIFYRGVQKTLVLQSTDTNSGDTTTSALLCAASRLRTSHALPAACVRSFAVQSGVLPDGATFTLTSTGTPNLMTSTYAFSWIPPLDATSSAVCFKAQDSKGAFSLGNYCIALTIGQASIIYVSGVRAVLLSRMLPARAARVADPRSTRVRVVSLQIIRDFLPTHPDFNVAGGPLDATKFFVKNQLGQDGKPQFDAAAGATSVQSATTFNQWFNDVPNVNQKTVLSLTLSNGTEPDGRVRC
jgi:hypothetical protein